AGAGVAVGIAALLVLESPGWRPDSAWYQRSLGALVDSPGPPVSVEPVRATAADRDRPMATRQMAAREPPGESGRRRPISWRP
ncbi:MAG: hypothetical protein ACR2NH_10610, partial [Solirubrobacteraceae bacterium]